MRDRLPSVPRLIVALLVLAAVGVWAGRTGTWSAFTQAFFGGDSAPAVSVPKPNWGGPRNPPSHDSTSGDAPGGRDAAAAGEDAAWGAGQAAALTADQARTALDGLEVKGKAPKTGYGRDQFGPAWADADSNGCDQRNDVLARDLADIVFADAKNCVVASGALPYEPYTAATSVPFVRGGHDGEALDIDHVVALGDAWVTGAWQWSAAEREAFANDLANLLAVDPGANRAKGDSNAAEWLPANTAYRCVYVAKQIDVKNTYRLAVTQAEKDAMARVLDGCAG